MTVPTALRWTLLALAGLLVAVAVAILASKLTSQRIGLASEPLEAGQSLAPPAHRPANGDGRQPQGNGAGPTTSTTVTTPPEPTTTTAPSPPATTPDDSGAGGDSGGETSDDD